MDTIFKKALDRVTADDALKQKTADFIMSLDSTVVSFDAASNIRRRPAAFRRLAFAACAAVLLCTLSIGGYAVYQTPTSYISVDINPSVELGINAFAKVVRVTPFNEDGETVVGALHLMNKNVESAVRLIVAAAADKGFIKDNGTSAIAVTAITNSDAAAEKLEDSAKAGAENALDAEDGTAIVEAEHIRLDRRDDAIALGISPGKLNLIEKLQSLDPSIDLATYKDATVSEIQKKFTELKKENKVENKGNDTAATSSPAEAQAPASPPPDASPNSPPSPEATQRPGNGNNSNHNGSGNGSKDPANSDSTAGDNNGNNGNHGGDNGNHGHGNNSGNHESN
jgi:hypothetical protein